MTAAHDHELVTQLIDAVAVVQMRIEDGTHLVDPTVADAVLWRTNIIVQAVDRLPAEFIGRHPEVDWHGIRRLGSVADGTLGGLTRDEAWKTLAAVLPVLRHAMDEEAGRQELDDTDEAPARRVLLVDDDPDIRRILDLLLTHAGFEVIEAEDGEEALSRARDVHPDAVVADVQMPNMDGISLVHRLRDVPAMRHTPVLLFTGRPPQAGLDGVLQLDRVRYMSKGDPRKISEALGEMLADPVGGRARSA